MINFKKITANNGRYRIRIAIVAFVAGLAIGWQLPLWTHAHIEAVGIDGRIQQCLMDNQ